MAGYPGGATDRRAATLAGSSSATPQKIGSTAEGQNPTDREWHGEFERCPTGPWRGAGRGLGGRGGRGSGRCRARGWWRRHHRRRRHNLGKRTTHRRSREGSNRRPSLRRGNRGRSH